MAGTITIRTKRATAANAPAPTADHQRAQRRRAGLEDLQALVAFVAAKELPVPDLNLLVVQPIDFAGEDWDLAATSLGIEARIDVVAGAGTPPEHICRVAAVMRPDAIVLDWRAPEAPALFDVLRRSEETTRVPVMVISDDGESAAPRLLCGVWEDPAPQEFDDVMHLLDAINSRTMITRLAPQSEACELQAWFSWVSQTMPSHE